MERGDRGPPALKSNQLFFSKSLKILLKNAVKEERHSHLTVDAEQLLPNGELFRKELLIRITDEEDPLFFYHMKLNDEDYQTLRVQQGLLVDFLAFPQKFIDLLELCHQDELTQQPRFVLQLSFAELQEGARLSIVEVNPFKHLVHLSLQLVAGTDYEVKRFLSSVLKATKSVKVQLQNRLQATESELSSRLREHKDRLAEKSQEVDGLRHELREKTSTLQNRYDLQVNLEKDRILQVEHNLQDKHERRLREITDEHRELVGRLESSLAARDAQTRDLTAERHQADSSIRDLRTRLDASEGELRTLRHDSQELNRNNTHLTKSRDEWERSAGQLTGRVTTLEREAREREAQLVRLQIQVDTFTEQKAGLVKQLDENQTVILKRTNHIKGLSADVLKGNEIIQKLQAEIKNLQSKLKIRSQVTEEQEKVVTEKEKQVDSMQSRLAALEDRLEQHKKEEKRLQDSLTEAQQRIEDSSKVIRTNENVINWLNKQLNEAQSGRPKPNLRTALDGKIASPSSCSADVFATSTPGAAIDGRTPPSLSNSANLGQAFSHSSARRSPFSAVPEESNIPFDVTVPRNSGAENNPSLDPKYWRAKSTTEERMPGSASSARGRSRGMVSNVRLPRTSIAPLPPNKEIESGGFPISSAYFPP